MYRQFHTNNKIRLLNYYFYAVLCGRLILLWLHLRESASEKKRIRLLPFFPDIFLAIPLEPAPQRWFMDSICLRPLWAEKTGFILIIFHFIICGKLCDK